MSKIIAILTSDIHLSLKCPIARSAEENWLKAMKRPLDELRELADKHDACIIYAGDLFDRAVGNSELINFAIDNLPKGLAVWGQHDAPLHSEDELYKSTYQTMVKFGILKNLEQWEFFQSDILSITGFHWGQEITPHDSDRQPENNRIQLAVIHKYIYTNKSNSYQGVDKGNHLSKLMKQLEGYDAVVAGDNHLGFHQGKVFNAGTLLRRKIDEIHYKPQVGLLHDDGTIIPHFLDTSQDKFIDIDEAKQKESQEIDTTAFLNELKSLGSDSLDFRDAINKYMDSKKVDSDVRELVLGTME